MRRTAIIIVVGVILSFVLMSVGFWIFLNTSSQGEWIRESAARGKIPEYKEMKERYGDPFDMMSRGLRIVQFVVLPIVALLTGACVGFLARRAVWQTAAISFAPVSLLVLAAHSWDLEGFWLSGLYLALCAAASLLLYRWKCKKLTADSISK